SAVVDLWKTPTSEEMVQAIKAVKERIESTIKSNPPAVVKAKADQALVAANSLILLLGPIDDGLNALTEQIIKPKPTDRQREKGPEGPDVRPRRGLGPANFRLLRGLGLAKDSISQARGLLVEALNSPRPDEVSRGLNQLAQEVEKEAKGGADGKP